MLIFTAAHHEIYVFPNLLPSIHIYTFSSNLQQTPKSKHMF
jgi:hypothetical protein